MDDRDRKTFLLTIEDVCRRYHWLIHAYCMMDNHYHLLIETPDGNLSIGMRQLNGVFTQRFNRRHKHTGHIFQGRYKSILVQKENYLLELSRYIVLNPVRAEMVEDAGDWKWSSYHSSWCLVLFRAFLIRRQERVLFLFQPVQCRRWFSYLPLSGLEYGHSKCG